jgi:chitodextrinase
MFNSYCGNEGFDNMPTDIDAEQLTYMDEHATEGRLSIDGGKTFFRIDQYNNHELVFNGLQQNKDYWFKCRAACDQNMWSPFSPLAKVRTKCRKTTTNETTIYSVNSGTQIGMDCTREADEYEFRMRLKGNSSWITSGMISQDHYTFPQQITKGDIYEFQSRIQCGGQWTDWSDIKEYSIPVQCPQPINGDIGVNNITDKTAHLFCHSGHGTGVIDKHHFRVRENSGSDWTEKQTDNTSIDFSNLKQNTEYVMQVQHECTNGVMGSWSNLVFFTTDQSCNLNSMAISIQDISYTSALLSCNQMNRDGYTWEVIRVRDDKMINIPNMLPNPTYQLSNLNQAEEYAVRLKVFCGTEVSEFTETVSFNTLNCLAPLESEISVSNIQNTTVILNYGGNINQGLQWQYRQSGNSNWRNFYSNQNSSSLDSLVKNAMYEYRLRIQCSDLPDIYSEWSAVHTFQTACSAFIDRFSAITSSSAKAHSNNANADFYEFRYSKSGMNNWTMLSQTMETFIDIGALEENTEYEVQVRSICNNQTGNWSASENFTTKDMKEPPCKTVKKYEMNVSGIGPYSANLNCNRGNVDAYFFRYRMFNGGNWIETQGLPTETFLATGLQENTIYDYQSKVQCGMTVTEWSDTLRFRTEVETFGLSSGCPAPFTSDFIASGIGVFTAVLNGLKSADEYGFRYREMNSVDWIELQLQANNRFTITNLKANTKYEYQCRLVCNGLVGIYSASKFFTTLNPANCNAPGTDATVIANIGTSDAIIAMLEQGVKYQIRFKNLHEDSWIYGDTVSVPLFHLNGLESGQEYVYQLRRMCLNNEVSDFSNSKTFRTLQTCDQIPIQELRVDSVSIDSALVSSREANLKSAYFFRYRPTGSKEWIVVINLVDFRRFAILSPLKEDTEYEFQVLGVCSEKSISSWSASKTFRTPKATAVKYTETGEFMVYPNPASNYIVLENHYDSQEFNWQIIDLHGRIYQTGKLNGNSKQKISLKLASGIYILKATSDRFKIVRKLTIE